MGAGGMRPAGQGGGRRRRSRVDAPMSEINVTPFVDVMLVLLIIFMVAAPLMTLGVPLNLPETRAAALPQPTRTPTVVSIDAVGAVFLGEDRVTLTALPAALSAAARRDDRIYLRVDDVTPHGRVAEVMAELSRGGFRNIAFVSRNRGG